MTRHIVSILTLIAAATLFATPPSAPAHAAGSCYGTGKRITINTHLERLRAWDGCTVVLVTLVTTGNAELPTPLGHFEIYAKYSPYTFISPWSRSSPYWYPPSRVSFAMEFLRGYFIHDAPWRSVFGPGSNSGTQPGTNYGGTHGCVNVPYWAERFLYYWAPIGTPVHIMR
ncbi:MAG TPA: L,D-transpeptidase [Chloroflexota bacterium]|nr:L,D-transpeptidase [Chloroflexota bacterium]